MMISLEFGLTKMIELSNNITFSIVFISILLIFGVYWVFTTRQNAGPKPQSLDTKQVTVKGKTFIVQVAEKPSELQKGLMFKESMKDEEGMLFVFPRKSIYPFWMKNTLIPLDIIWIDENKKVVYIKNDAQPCSNVVEAACKSVVPTKIAKYVLELNGGKALEIGLKVGDEIGF